MRRWTVEEEVLVGVGLGLGRGAAVERRAAVPGGIVDWVGFSWRLLEDWNFLMRRIRGALVFDDIRGPVSGCMSVWRRRRAGLSKCGDGARDGR